MNETSHPRIRKPTVSVASPLLFFAVTFAITWSFWLGAIVFGLRFDSAAGFVVLLAGLFGPGIAGIGFTYLVYDERGRRDYWDRVRDVRRIGGPWALVILFLTLVLTVIAAGLDILLGGAGATWGDAVAGVASSPLSILPAMFFATLPPLLEELGWRGYVLDRLQLTWSALGASLLLGIVWSVWHLPLFFVEGSYQHGLGVGTAAFWLFTIGIVPLSVAFTWLYNNTSRSILAVILFHGMVNFTSELVAVTQRADAFTILLWIALAVALTAVWGPKTLRGVDAVPRPPPRRTR
ncbi:CPBP family intramembrane glutamic endopeptidase [Halopiger aswanensis]|uniref:CAAX prenyl protease-like protein n=1 Tax=Halopiger aswanensis TaxID=148449 RepID=A0A419W155_9EURY|nr:type II CAAX endopeptidase family protein [Halopiger aswanensis]RKD89000.1 CAAX prenyl protease-like protein [Halopiger aswanensis]